MKIVEFLQPGAVVDDLTFDVQRSAILSLRASAARAVRA